MKSSKTIFAISGSLRAGSSNHAILNFLGKNVPNDIIFEIYNNLANIPPFDPGLDRQTPPEAVAELRNAIAKADALIICTPEYAFGVPGQLKNALDWLVSSSTLVDKPVALITASSSGQYAHPSLLLTLGALSANVVEGACLLTPFIRAKIDGDGNVTDNETAENLKKVLDALLIVGCLIEEKPVAPKTNASFRGMLSKEEGDELQEYVKKSRSEWDRDF